MNKPYLVLERLLDQPGIVSSFQLYDAWNAHRHDRLDLIQVGDHFVVRQNAETPPDNNKPPYGMVNVLHSQGEGETWMYENLKSKAREILAERPEYGLEDRVQMDKSA